MREVVPFYRCFLIIQNEKERKLYLNFPSSQRVIYMTNMSRYGVREVQDLELPFGQFQIGFEGAYTGLLLSAIILLLY